MRAAKLYERFHSSPVAETWPGIRIDWPEHPVVVGRLARIVYRSDKWREGVHDYEHAVETPVEVIVDQAFLPALGEAFRGKTRAAKIPRPPRDVARLGDGIELVVALPGTARATLRTETGPRLYDSPPLVTFDAGAVHYYAIPVGDLDQAIVLRGKGMRVTERGLVG